MQYIRRFLIGGYRRSQCIFSFKNQFLVALVPEGEIIDDNIIESIEFCILNDQVGIVLIRFKRMTNTGILYILGHRDSLVAKISAGNNDILSLFGKMQEQLGGLWLPDMIGNSRITKQELPGDLGIV